MLGLVALWGLRLSIYIGIRHKDEDFRYKQMRQDWHAKGGQWGVLWRSLVYVFLLQFFFNIVIGSSAYYTCLSAKDDGLSAFDVIGTAVFLAGLAIEIIADAQLRNHLKNPNKKSKFI